MISTRTKRAIADTESAAKLKEASVAALQAGGERATQLIENAQVKMQSGVANAMKYWEDTIALGQGNLAAMMTSSKIVTDGLKELKQQVADTSRANIEQSVAFTKSLMGAKSFEQAIDLQSGFIRGAMETAMAQNQELQAATARLARQAAEPLAERMKLSVAALKNV